MYFHGEKNIKIKPNSTYLIFFFTRPYLEHYDEYKNGQEHHDERVDEPRSPVDAVSETHNLHHLLETSFLLVDDGLTQHGGRENPRQDHEQGQHA